MSSSLAEIIDEIGRGMEKLGRGARVMEVCGTHTVTACRTGLKSLLPESLKLISGPGCPVCVTPTNYIDRAIMISRYPGVTAATFGDLMRVPGSLGSLERARAGGSDIRMVYSVADALELAGAEPLRQVIFLAVGFETTAPGIAWAVRAASERGLKNFFVLCALKTMPGAMAALLRAGDLNLDGFICPGHVSVITGTKPYEFICRDFRLPCVVAGFEGSDMAAALAMILRQLLAGKAEVENEYRRSVSPGGNPQAMELVEEVFSPTEAEWRGLGFVPASGLELKEQYRQFDAGRRFPVGPVPNVVLHRECLCGEVLCGRSEPQECPLFGKVCTPVTPFGACMVSSEGTCAAHYKYVRRVLMRMINPSGPSG